MRIIGYHISESITVNTEDGPLDGELPIEYLLKPKEDSIRLFFHLGYSIANLLRMLRITEEEGRELLYTTFLHTSSYRLRYVPHKFFSIKRAGAFAYFSDASQYRQLPNAWLLKGSSELASMARAIGSEVYEVLKELGIEATSLINPVRAYEKTPQTLLPLEQIDRLYKEKEEASEVKRNVIQSIIYGIVEKDFDIVDKIEDRPSPITLDIAIRKNKWRKLGKLV